MLTPRAQTAPRATPDARVLFALNIAAGVAVMAFLLVYASIVRLSEVPFITQADTGELDSVTETLLITGVVVAGIVTLFSYQRFVRYGLPSRWLNRVFDIVRRLVSRLVLTVTASVVSLALLVIIGAPLLRLLQLNVPALPPLVIALMAALSAFVIAFACAYFTSRMTTRALVILVGFVLAVGMVASVLLASDSEWWTRAISYLGVGEYGFVFSWTITLTGMLLLVLLLDKLGDLNVLRVTGAFQAPWFETLRVGVVVLCLSLSAVGAFPAGGSVHLIHQIMAHITFILIILMMLTSWLLLPIYPTSFRNGSLSAAAISIAAVIGYFSAGVPPFSAMELIVLIAGTIWIFTFYLYTRRYVLSKDPTLITASLAP
jgi:hypothetical protein